MSARNYPSARDKIGKIIDCLPNIKQQKFGYRTSQDLPVLSANSSTLVNRNLGYLYELQSYSLNTTERAGTPFSDFFSESETSTPDFNSAESDSSSGSALRRNTAEATRSLVDEWECIERTLYDEDGEKSTRLPIIEECNQWKQLHPQLRVVGKAIPLPALRRSSRRVEQEEVIAMHYSDYEPFSESDERLSQSSTDVTPRNSPRPSLCDALHEPRISRDRFSCLPQCDEEPGLPDSFCSLLQITPLHIRSPLPRKRTNTSILRSEQASSRWMRHSRPDSSANGDRNSAKSFVSLDTRKYGVALSASERNKVHNNRVVTARYRESTRLDPLRSPELSQSEPARRLCGISPQFSFKRVSLPPLLLEEEKKKVASAKKHNSKKKSNQRSLYQLDKMRQK